MGVDTPVEGTPFLALRVEFPLEAVIGNSPKFALITGVYWIAVGIPYCRTHLFRI